MAPAHPILNDNQKLRAVITAVLLGGRALPDGDSERESVINKAVWHADKIIATVATVPSFT
jgi:hypothetical protein